MRFPSGIGRYPYVLCNRTPWNRLKGTTELLEMPDQNQKKEKGNFPKCLGELPFSGQIEDATNRICLQKMMR